MALPRPLRWPVDLAVTLVLWVYFLGGGFVFLLPAYLVALIFARHRRAAVQRLHHWFFRGFFALLRALDPGLHVRLDPAIREIRGAVVICNHLSYFDPLLMLALFPRHTTFVRRRFFPIPLFGWCLRAAGYLAAAEGSGLDERSLRRVETLGQHLADGGILFLFPEGRRGRAGTVQKFHAGAFRLARRFDRPLELLVLEGTDQVFPRGSVLVRTCLPIRISVERLGPLPPPADGEEPGLSGWIEAARRAYERRLTAGH